MKVYVNDGAVDLAPGMKVKHALIQYGLIEETGETGETGEIGASKKVYDEWGNEIGLDGALSEGMKLYVKAKPTE